MSLQLFANPILKTINPRLTTVPLARGTTPVVTTTWTYLSRPDTNGTYRVTVKLDPSDTAQNQIIQDIQKAEATFKSLAKSSSVVKNQTYATCLKQAKDGPHYELELKPFDKATKPDVVDSKLNPLPSNIAILGGTELICAFSVRGSISAQWYSVRAILDKAQIIKLATSQGGNGGLQALDEGYTFTDLAPTEGTTVVNAEDNLLEDF